MAFAKNQDHCNFRHVIEDVDNNKVNKKKSEISIRIL